MLVTVDIPENKVPFMMELLESLNFVPKKMLKALNKVGLKPMKNPLTLQGFGKTTNEI